MNSHCIFLVSYLINSRRYSIPNDVQFVRQQSQSTCAALKKRPSSSYRDKASNSIRAERRNYRGDKRKQAIYVHSIGTENATVPAFNNTLAVSEYKSYYGGNFFTLMGAECVCQERTTTSYRRHIVFSLEDIQSFVY